MSKDNKENKKNFGFAKDQVRHLFTPTFIQINDGNGISYPFDNYLGIQWQIERMVTNDLGYNHVRDSEEYEKGQMYGETGEDLKVHLGKMEQKNIALDRLLYKYAGFDAMFHVNVLENLINSLHEKVDEIEEALYFHKGNQIEIIKNLGLTPTLTDGLSEEKYQELVKKGKEEYNTFPKEGSNVKEIRPKKLKSPKRKRQGIYHWFYND